MNISLNEEITVTPQPLNGASNLNSSNEVSITLDVSSPVDLSASPATPVDIKIEDGIAKVTENDSIRDLIMSAIGVMKSRKARPDTKRISSWIHRRYGKPIADVSDELERLVAVGELARVDYKGSASFRITANGAKMRRKRKTNKPLGRAPMNNPVPLGGMLPPMFRLNPDGSGPEVTLHQLVIEHLSQSPQQVRFDQGLNIPTKYIAKAVESSTREFSKAAVLGNLDIILERECVSGLFQKLDADNYRLLPRKPQVSLPLPIHSLPNGTICTPMPAPPPQFAFQDRTPGSTPEVSFTPTSNFQSGGMISVTSSPGPSTPIMQQIPQAVQPMMVGGYTIQGQATSTPTYQGGQNGIQNFASPPMFPASFDRSDEQIKNDLIRCQLSKMSTKDAKAKSPSKRATDDNFRPRKLEPPSPEHQKLSSPPPTTNGELARSIWLPANETGVEMCIQCRQGPNKFPKMATEAFLRCKDCPTRAHPGCLNYSESLAQRSLTMPWQCRNCKPCSVCHKSVNRELMIFCDCCDLGYHLPCHDPPMSFRPVGRWECFRCQPVNNSENGAKMTNGLRQSIIPVSGEMSVTLAAPPSGAMASSWQNVDVPDVSEWSSHQIAAFFVQNGFGHEVCKTFIDQELDGKSILLMQRGDVINGLGLKLGPALKVFSLVKKFQLKQICCKS